MILGFFSLGMELIYTFSRGSNLLYAYVSWSQTYIYLFIHLIIFIYHVLLLICVHQFILFFMLFDWYFFIQRALGLRTSFIIFILIYFIYNRYLYSNVNLRIALYILYIHISPCSFYFVIWLPLCIWLHGLLLSSSFLFYSSFKGPTITSSIFILHG